MVPTSTCMRPAHMLHRGLDEQPPLLVGQREELAGGAEDDDAGHPELDLPVEEPLPGGMSIFLPSSVNGVMVTV